MLIRRASANAITIASVLLFVIACGGGSATESPKPIVPAPVTSVVVALSAPSALLGATVQATVTTRDAAGNQLTGRAVTWSSTSTSVATVAASGVVTAALAGTSQITATSEGVSGAQTFTAVSVASLVDSIVLSVDSTELIIGDTVRIAAVPRDAAGHALTGVKLTFTSSAPTVATVSADGLVTSRGFGEAFIDVSVSTTSISASVASTTPSVTVTRGPSRTRVFSAPRIVITPVDQTVDAGATVTYTARLTDLNNNTLLGNYTIHWSSSSISVATISQNGVATAVRNGTTTIKASVNTGVSHEFTPASTPLRVIACGGFMNVENWSAAVQTQYFADKTITNGPIVMKFNVDQTSGGTTELRRVSLDAAGENAVWEGVIAGTAHVNDKYEQSISGTVTSTITDIGDGPQVAALASLRLTARFVPGGICTYSIRYVDDLARDHKETPNPPGRNYSETSTLGIAAAKILVVGAKPATGWKVEKTLTVRALLFPAVDDGEELAPLFVSYYTPLLSIVGTMFVISNTNELGTATFAYTLTAH